VVNQVSIPHWFSLNSSFSALGDTWAYVSIPHWFSLNLANVKLYEISYLPVSIPHWFSLNEIIYTVQDLERMFPSHIGSRSTHNILFGGQQAAVSIPHWFSLNTQTARKQKQY